MRVCVTEMNERQPEQPAGGGQLNSDRGPHCEEPTKGTALEEPTKGTAL